MKNSWNERYSEKEYVYGEAPNIFFAEQIAKLIPGTIIMPCEGEGRNAVHVASLGWKVRAFDNSDAGKAKAMELAAKKNVTIEYTIGDAMTIGFPENSVDSVAFIFAHFPPPVRTYIHQKAIAWLKPGGKIILEAFDLQQLQNTSGGPKDISLLYTENILKEDFEDLEIELIQTVETVLNEGKYHQGKADLVRLVGTKKHIV